MCGRFVYRGRVIKEDSSFFFAFSVMGIVIRRVVTDKLAHFIIERVSIGTTWVFLAPVKKSILVNAEMSRGRS